jgi:hypothetical protein
VPDRIGAFGTPDRKEKKEKKGRRGIWNREWNGITQVYGKLLRLQERVIPILAVPQEHRNKEYYTGSGASSFRSLFGRKKRKKLRKGRKTEDGK